MFYATIISLRYSNVNRAIAFPYGSHRCAYKPGSLKKNCLDSQQFLAGHFVMFHV
jgi:hypothetical protein